MVKFNIDVAFREELEIGGCGKIAKDSTGY
jgi:hypothetical protein